MGREVLVPFLKSIVFLNVVEVVPSDHNGLLHLHALNHTSQYSAPDAYISSKWTLLVHIVAFVRLKAVPQTNWKTM